MNIVQEVCRVLEENYIGFKRVQLDSLNSSRHNILTDRARVSVKLLKPDNHPRFLQNEVDFAVNTVYGTNPLLENVYHISSFGTPLIMSAWEWESQHPVGVNMNSLQAAAAAAELFKLHASKKYPQLISESTDYFTNYGERLTSPSFRYLTATNQRRLRELFVTIIKPNTDLLGVSPELNVVSHGDLAPEKLMMRDDYSVFWSNYEEARSAPREYDLAFLLLHLNYRMESPELWQIVRREYEKLLGASLNDDRLNQLATLLLGRKALSVASKTLHATDEGKLSYFLKELEPLTKGATLEEIKNLPHLH